MSVSGLWHRLQSKQFFVHYLNSTQRFTFKFRTHDLHNMPMVHVILCYILVCLQKGLTTFNVCLQWPQNHRPLIQWTGLLLMHLCDHSNEELHSWVESSCTFQYACGTNLNKRALQRLVPLSNQLHFHKLVCNDQEFIKDNRRSYVHETVTIWFWSCSKPKSHLGDWLYTIFTSRNFFLENYSESDQLLRFSQQMSDFRVFLMKNIHQRDWGRRLGTLSIHHRWSSLHGLVYQIVIVRHEIRECVTTP